MGDILKRTNLFTPGEAEFVDLAELSEVSLHLLLVEAMRDVPDVHHTRILLTTLKQRDQNSDILFLILRVNHHKNDHCLKSDL